jgi:hypothetical protein
MAPESPTFKAASWLYFLFSSYLFKARGHEQLKALLEF